MTKAEHENLQRQARENAAALKKFQDDDAERQRKADEEAGNHKAIADREKARADAAEQKALELEQTQQKADRERRVETIARSLKYRNPADVMNRVPDDALDSDDKVRKVLTDLAKESAYLIQDGETPKTRDQNNGDVTKQDDAQPTGVDRMSRAYADTSKT
jgi:hypothetical protein